MRAPVSAAVILLGVTCTLSASAFDKHECVQASEDGQAQRREGHLISARDRFAVCADASCPAVVRQSCGEWLASIDGQIPTVLFAVKDGQGNDLADARLTLDGKPMTALDGGRPLQLDPGKHTLQATAATGENAQQTFVLLEGEVRRLLTVTIPLRSGAGARTTSPSQPRGLRWPFWTSAIVGGVAWASFGGFALSGAADYRQLEHDCKPHCNASRYDPIDTKFIVADISLGVAIVATGLATWLFLTRSSTSDTGRADVLFRTASSLH